MQANNIDTFALPPEFLKVYEAHLALKERYFEDTGLKFTLDGRLLGDMGETLAVLHFGIALCNKKFGEKRKPGVDGYIRLDGPDTEKRSVQVKATGNTISGPAFSPGKGRAEFLLFFILDFDSGFAQVAYSGPERNIRKHVPEDRSSTYTVELSVVRDEYRKLITNEKLLPKPAKP